MPEEVEKQARKELKRLERMPEAAGRVLDAPHLPRLADRAAVVEARATTPIDIAEARAILDEDHYGLEKVKRRILEFLAVRKLKPDGKSPILCFVGPPGVGKTSLGQSIARATGRKFVRAQPRRRARRGGDPRPPPHLHRRAAGQHHPAHPQGRHAQSVFMLDEIDKLGAGFHGDPSSALLEVLDPEQNSTFRDNYLERAVRPVAR